MPSASTLATVAQQATVTGLIGGTFFMLHTIYTQLSFLKTEREDVARGYDEADERRKKSGNPFKVVFKG